MSEVNLMDKPIVVKRQFFDKWTIMLIAIIVVGVCVVTSNCIRKYGLLFVDESWAYGAANSRNTWSFNGYSPYTWIKAEAFKEFLTVQENERFSLYDNGYDVAHPSLHFFLLHTISSFFPNQFSKWYGLSINLLCYIGTIIVIYLLANCLFHSKKKALFASAVWAFSLGAISSVLYIRMYLLLTFFTLLALFFVICYFLETKRKYLIGMAISFVLAGLTEYSFWLFAFFMAFSFFILTIRRWKKWLPFAFTAVGAFIAQCVMLPTTLIQFFKIENIRGAFQGVGANNLIKVLNVGEVIRRLVIDFVDRFFLFSISKKTIFVTFLFICIVVFAHFVFRHYKADAQKPWYAVYKHTKEIFAKNARNLALIIVFLSWIMCAYLTEAIRPFDDYPAANRFSFYLYPSWSIFITFVISFFYSRIKSINKYIKIVISVVLLLIFVKTENISLRSFTKAEPLFKVKESWFLKEYSNNVEKFDELIMDSYVFLMPHNSDIIILQYTYPLIKELYALKARGENMSNYDYGKIIINQIKRHIPQGEKITILYQWEDLDNLLTDDDDFVSLLNENGLSLDLRSIRVGVYGGYNVYDVSYVADEYKVTTIRLRNERNIYQYLDLINDPRFTIFIAVKDECAVNMNNAIMSGLQALGLKEDLRDKIQQSYITIIEGEQVIYETLAPDKTTALKNAGVLKNGTAYSLHSASLPSGNKASIIIDEFEYAVNWRGLNIVVYDNDTGRVVDSVAFDTWSRGLEAHRKPLSESEN
jgi:hypothetical protein